MTARFDNLSDWLAWQESCHPQAIDLGLDRVRQVAVRLGLVTPRAKLITVAGTNGKGSCVRALDALLRKSGARVGSYTSPHLLAYNERFRIDGQYVGDDLLCEAFAAIDQTRGEITLTYFEFATLAAFYLFSKAQLDYWLLEVGLGGRLDATNVLDADIAVITSIDLDHTEWLGEDRESIGREKAGICRAAAPVVCADPEPPASVSRMAQQLSCPFHALGVAFGFHYRDEGVQFWIGQQHRFEARVNLPPASLAAALMVLDLLGLLPGGVGQGALTTADVQACLTSLSLQGRTQVVLRQGRQVLLDVAHNAAAMTYLQAELHRRYPGQQFNVVLAMMSDKNIAESLAQLTPVAQRWYLATIPGLTRAATSEFLADCLHGSTERALFGSVEEALAKALSDDPATPVLVTGSFYTVAAALAALRQDEDSRSDG